MTTETPKPVEVTQADRDLGLSLGLWKDQWGNKLEGVDEGRYDESLSMQRIARHRIAAALRTQAQGASK